MKFSKTLFAFFALMLTAGLASADDLGMANLVDDQGTISLKGKSVNQVHKSKNHLNEKDDLFVESVTTLSGSPTYGSTALTVSVRNKWYTGDIYLSGVTHGSTITGVDFSLNLFGGTATDLSNVWVYLCRNQGTNCRQITGVGNASTGTWNGTATWAGATTLSPGWEYWVGVAGSGYMNQTIGFTGSVNMSWN